VVQDSGSRSSRRGDADNSGPGAAASDATAFGLNRKDQEELWRFLTSLMASAEDVKTLWSFAADNPVVCRFLLDALLIEASERGVTPKDADLRTSRGDDLDDVAVEYIPAPQPAEKAKQQ
jgi:hypothetical protein